MTRKLSSIPALLAMLAFVLVPAAAQAYVPAGFFGVSPQGPAKASDFELMRTAGVLSVRLPLNWSAVQSASPSVSEPDWSSYDHWVELAAETGIRVMPFVSSSPAWVAADPMTLPVRSAWQRASWASFLRQAERRYGPGGEFWDEHTALPYLPIRSWEIWNEENIVTFTLRPEPLAFAALIRISGRVLHHADPESKVILGGLFGRPLQIPPNIASGDYLSRFYRARHVKQYFDGVALHPYVADARAMGAQIVNLRRIMAVHHDSSTPIYITELGWGSNGGPTRWERGLWGQANELSRSFAMLSDHRLSWHVGGAWWFTWSDEPDTCQFCTSAGLLTEKREAKPSWYRFNAWTGGDADTVPRAQIGAGGLLEEAEPEEEAPAPQPVTPIVE
jgi:hypothetical protein